jgi:hypothetical protein
VTLSIGLGVASDAVRMVGTRDGRIVWAGETPRDDATTLEMAVDKLLSTVDVPRWPKPRVTVAVGPAQAQTKHLVGLPPLTDSRALERVVSESAGRFFLRNGIPLATTSVRIDAPGEAWAAAVDEPVVRDIAHICHRRGFILSRVVPTVAVLGAALEGDRIVWMDGDVASELSLREHVLVGVRRVPIGREHHCAAMVAVEELQTLGDEAWRFADAFAAATMSASQSLTLRPGVIPGSAHPPLPRWRLVVAAAACALAACAALAAPGLAAARTSRAASAQIAELAPARSETVRAEASLRKVTDVLREAAEFDDRRRSATLFLGELTEAIPTDAQIVALRIDSAGGNLVALAPHAAALMTNLETVSTVASPEIIGPVTRETSGGSDRERLTLRFRWSAGALRPAQPSAAASAHTMSRGSDQ